VTIVDISKEVTFNKKCSIMFWLYVNKMPSNYTLLQFGDSSVVKNNPSTATARNLTGSVVTNNGIPNMTFSLPCSNPNTCDITALDTITLPYVPIARWTHYVVTIDLPRQKMIAYVDADKVTETSISSSSAFPTGKELIIGGTATGLEALLSNVAVNNTVMEVEEVYKYYYKGPVTSTISSIGLPAYGIRYPVYQMSS
jgi:hypothetical protein